MVIDLKYHLTTIIAIFLALGIGILVGSAMIGDDGIVREQQKLIVQIEEDMQSLRSQNSQFKNKVLALEGMLVEQEQFIDLLFQDAITDQLSGMRGLMVRDSSKAMEANASLVDVLRLAGMEITEFSSLPENWAQESRLSTDSTEPEDGNLARLQGPDEGEIDSPDESSEIINWDLCLLMTQSMPPQLEEIFQKEQIYRPISKQLNSKKGLYELITSLRQSRKKKTPITEKQEVWHDLSSHTSVQ